MSVVLGLARDGQERDPAPDAPLPYPDGTRTGLLPVDTVLQALEASDRQALISLFISVPSPCVVAPQGITNPPLCPGDVPAGTLVPTFRATACESVWPDYLPTALDFLLNGPHPVLAIYRNAKEAYGWLPAADFAVVVQTGSPAAGWPAVVRLSGRNVNGIAFGCGQRLSDLLEGVAQSDFVLPPLQRLPVAATAPAAPVDVHGGLIACITTPCPGYYVQWTDTSANENGFLIYWRETACSDETRPPALIAIAPAGSTRQEELAIPFRDDCRGNLGVAAYNGIGVSDSSWAAHPP